VKDHNKITNSELKIHINSTIKDICESQYLEKQVFKMKDETVLLESSGLDSLGFAILVTRLEEELGYDPFTLSSEAYYPRTFGDFVDFYWKYSQK